MGQIECFCATLFITVVTVLAPCVCMYFVEPIPPPFNSENTSATPPPPTMRRRRPDAFSPEFDSWASQLNEILPGTSPAGAVNGKLERATSLTKIQLSRSPGIVGGELRKPTKYLSRTKRKS